ncbi:MAG: hypothetical protein QOH64_3434 [Acidimicrobiaceae bacterium]
MNAARLGAAAVVVVLLGCSSGKADPRTAFIKSAAKVCDDNATAIEVASAQITAQSNEEQVALFLKQTLVPLYRTRLDALRALTPPPGDAATIKTLLDDQAKVVDAIEADPNTFTKLATDPFAQVDTRWDAYGLTQCGSRSALPSSS